MADYFIFAMAPIGILTAIISVIWMCGSPSLRAFIGRAQEGEGIAESELCSSTSRDVCKLYNNGGTARVFGCPKLLDVVFDPSICGLKMMIHLHNTIDLTQVSTYFQSILKPPWSKRMDKRRQKG